MKNLSITSRLVVICLGMLCFGLVIPSAYGLTPGDVNDGGQIDIVDALLTARYAAGFNPAGFNTAVADVNSDGSITIIDALLIARFFAGVITAFPLPTSTPTPTSSSAPVFLLPVNTTGAATYVNPAYPEPDFTINLQHVSDSLATMLNWQFYELPANPQLATTAGSIASGDIFAVRGTVDWAGLTVGKTYQQYMYLYAANNTNKRYCRLLTIGLTVPAAEPTPTPTPIPCGVPRIGVATGYEYTVKYPNNTFSFQILDSGSTTTCTSGSFVIVIPEPQRPYLSVEPAAGSVPKITLIQTSTPTPAPTSSLPATPTPSPTASPGSVKGTINWLEVPAGAMFDYYCIVRIYPAFNAQPTQSLITVHADRTSDQ